MILKEWKIYSDKKFKIMKKNWILRKIILFCKIFLEEFEKRVYFFCNVFGYVVGM